jgi:rod shape-determining protein MreD
LSARPWVTWAVIGSTFLVAMLLSVYPLPIGWRWWRPEFVLMVAIYWIFAQPLRMSLVALCLLGVFQDVLEGTPLGQHGLALVIVAYICLLSWQRVRNYSLWQQSCWVFVLIAISQLTDSWVQAISGMAISGPEFLIPAFASACFWPVCYLILEFLRRRYQIIQ